MSSPLGLGDGGQPIHITIAKLSLYAATLAIETSHIGELASKFSFPSV